MGDDYGALRTFLGTLGLITVVVSLGLIAHGYDREIDKDKMVAATYTADHRPVVLHFRIGDCAVYKFYDAQSNRNVYVPICG